MCNNVLIFRFSYIFSSESSITEKRGIDLSNKYEKATTKMAPLTTIGTIVLAAMALFLTVAILYTYRMEYVKVARNTNALFDGSIENHI